MTIWYYQEYIVPKMYSWYYYVVWVLWFVLDLSIRPAHVMHMLTLSEDILDYCVVVG